MKVAVPSRYSVLGSREYIRSIRWGSLTIISAVRVRQQPLTHWSMPTHAASLSPYQVPLSHPSATPLLPTFLPYLALSLAPSLTHSLSYSPSLFPSLIPPGVTSFSRAHAALYRFISHRTRPLPLATAALFLSTLSLSRMLSFPSTLLRYGSRAGHRWGAGSLRSIYRTLIWSVFYSLYARAYIFLFFHVRNSRSVRCNTSILPIRFPRAKSFRGINHVKPDVWICVRAKFPASSIDVYVKIRTQISFVWFQQLAHARSGSIIPFNRDLRAFSSVRIVVSYATEHSYNSISYNEASLSKIKQRSRRILAVALFVRMCKQWNYPFPARIYPDDIQPVADLPAGKYSRFYGYVRIHL